MQLLVQILIFLAGAFLGFWLAVKTIFDEDYFFRVPYTALKHALILENMHLTVRLRLPIGAVNSASSSYVMFRS